MASTKGEFALTLKGTTYRFKLGTSALIELQEMVSTPTRVVPIEEILIQVHIGRIKYMRAFLWAGLQKHHAGMTLEDVSDLLDESSEAEIGRLLRDLGLTVQPAPEDSKELGATGKKRPRTARGRRPGTGENSTSPPVVPASAEPSLTT